MHDKPADPGVALLVSIIRTDRDDELTKLRAERDALRADTTRATRRRVA